VDTHHPTTRSLRAALLLGLLSFAITAATAAQAGNQLFEGSWTVKSQGNECSLADPSPGPYCGNGWSESEFYSAYGLPQGIQCNPIQPRCPFDSTPTDGAGVFAPLGGTQTGINPFCAPWADWLGQGTTARPAKGETQRYTGMQDGKVPPLYRNPAFFTDSGEPNTTYCVATSTGATPGGKGLVQAGNPVTGTWTAITTGTDRGGFDFAAAPKNHAAGVRAGQGDFGYTHRGYRWTQGSARSGAVGEFASIYPYLYSYTYATLRNDAGVFGPGEGPGSFNLVYNNVFGTRPLARINVKQGAVKFGGTMKMLGALTTKVCYYRNGGCSWADRANWRYEAIGAAANTSGGLVTGGYLVTTTVPFYHPDLRQSSITELFGYRFPWTTGSVTVTATARGPHKTVHYAHGYDNRNTTTPSGKGMIQLVTPLLTRWLSPAVNFETAGIAILRIKFVPEPQAWVMLVAGASLLGLGTRMRGR
jgi:hypothetical protein